METTHNSVKLGIKVNKLVKKSMGWEVTVTERASGCHLILATGRLQSMSDDYAQIIVKYAKLLVYIKKFY